MFYLYKTFLFVNQFNTIQQTFIQCLLCRLLYKREICKYMIIKQIRNVITCFQTEDKYWWILKHHPFWSGTWGEASVDWVFALGLKGWEEFEWEIKCQLWPVLSGPTMTAKVTMCRRVWESRGRLCWLLCLS